MKKLENAQSVKKPENVQSEKKSENMYYPKAVELAATVTTFLQYSYIPYMQNGDKSFEKKMDQVSKALADVINDCINNSTWMKNKKSTAKKQEIDSIAVKLSLTKTNKHGKPPKENIVLLSTIEKVLEKFGFSIEDFELAPDRAVYAFSEFNEEGTSIKIRDFHYRYHTRAILRIAKNDANNGRLDLDKVKTELIKERSTLESLGVLGFKERILQENIGSLNGRMNFEQLIGFSLWEARQRKLNNL